MRVKGDISPTQSFLRLPRRVANRAGQTLLSQQKLSADPGREPVAPRGLDQHATCRAVPGLGDPALTPRAPAGVLGRHQAEIRHKLAWIGEARDIADLGDQRCRSHPCHAAQRPQRVHHCGERPIRQRRRDVGP